MLCGQKLLSLPLALLAVVALSAAQECSFFPDYRLDCLPDEKVLLNPNETCISYGCCWNPVANKSIGLKIGTPNCFFPSNHTGYTITGLRTTDYGHIASLTYVGPAGRRQAIINNLTLEVYHYESSNIVRVKIVDASKARYEVPDSYSVNLSDPKFSGTFNVTVVDDKLIIRDKTGKLLFSTALNAPIIYTDQFIQISTLIDSQYAYGIGETADDFAKPTNTWRQYSLFALDQPPGVGVNAYGVHPFAMFLRDDSSSYGMFLLNSNAMDIEITPLPSLTFRTIGGIIDLFLYAGNTPQTVIQQHLAVIGSPVMPPYWSLGFQLSRWGYENQSNLEAVINRNLAHEIPLDVQWFDIDTFDQKRDFTIDPVNFANLTSLVTELSSKGIQVVPIVDPAIPNVPNYDPYTAGLAKDIYIRDNGEILVGRVWPNDTVFPDFTDSKTEDWWYKCVSDYQKLVAFRGLWIDMNEPANFVNGSNMECQPSKYDDPPYVPQVRTDGAKLKFKTICMSSDQALGKHYDLHSLYGHYEAKVTFNVLQKLEPNRRPFVLTRSTFAGTGRYAHHWTGDVDSSWGALAQSIPDILNFNLFGIPFVGADICGFFNNAEEEMCLRWTQLGAFYPFMRNHNGFGYIDQDPAAWPNYRDHMKNAIRDRYRMLPYWYTLHYLAVKEGQTVVRPVWWEFPTETKAWNLNRQFMVGSAVMVIPAVWPVNNITNLARVLAYFPDSDWYSAKDGVRRVSSYGKEEDLKVGLDHIPVYYRGGSIIPVQTAEITTSATRKNKFSLLVALDYAKQSAYGRLYLDDGESKDVGVKALHYEFQVSQGLLEAKVVGDYDPQKDGFGYQLEHISFYGFKQDAVFTTDNGDVGSKIYSVASETMELDLLIDMRKNFTLKWTVPSAANNVVAPAGLLALLLLIQRMLN